MASASGSVSRPPSTSASTPECFRPRGSRFRCCPLAAAPLPRRAARSPSCCALTVITSYSIHYTKLYEAGCYKESDGCDNCYFYGPHAKRFGQNIIEKTDKFDWPIRKNAKGEYNIKGDKILATCFATDFFLPEADELRKEVWAMIKERQDIDFLILTKRIDRFKASLPADWGDGYDNINIGCTVETQALADYRLPLFLSYPMKRRNNFV